jgi:hypothetical protein
MCGVGNALSHVIGRYGSVLPNTTTLLNPQPLYDASVFQVFLNDLVDIFLVDIRVPDVFRINYYHGTLIATVEAAGIINPHSFIFAVEFERFNAFLRVIAQGLGSEIIATQCSRFALIYTKKYMPLVVAHEDLRGKGRVKNYTGSDQLGILISCQSTGQPLTSASAQEYRLA